MNLIGEHPARICMFEQLLIGNMEELLANIESMEATEQSHLAMMEGKWKRARRRGHLHLDRLPPQEERGISPKISLPSKSGTPPKRKRRFIDEPWDMVHDKDKSFPHSYSRKQKHPGICPDCNMELADCGCGPEPEALSCECCGLPVLFCICFDEPDDDYYSDYEDYCDEEYFGDCEDDYCYDYEMDF